jgi:hypothetical protein
LFFEKEQSSSWQIGALEKYEEDFVRKSCALLGWELMHNVGAYEREAEKSDMQGLEKRGT